MATTQAPVFLANVLFRVKYTFRLRKSLDGDPFLDTKFLVMSRDKEGRLMRYEVDKSLIMDVYNGSAEEVKSIENSVLPDSDLSIFATVDPTIKPPLNNEPTQQTFTLSKSMYRMMAENLSSQG